MMQYLDDDPDFIASCRLVLKNHDISIQNKAMENADKRLGKNSTHTKASSLAASMRKKIEGR